MMRSSQPTASVKKHIPHRTCVACRKIRPKRELIRLVCISDGSVEVDIGGEKAGRGAYLCAKQECWEIVLRGGRLEHALRTILTQDNREKLIKYGKALKESSSGESK